MSIEQIKHVSEFVSSIEKNSARFVNNPHLLYRGEDLTTYSLLPSIFRKMDDGKHYVYLHPNTELKIMVEFMTEAAGYIDNVSVDEHSRLIEYAQHFGIPTRLLDWTSNPLIALYFACQGNTTQDGRIYVFNSLAYRELINTDDRNHMEGKTIRDEIKKMVFYGESGFQYPVLYKPFYLNRRMVSQNSMLMAWGYEEKALNEIIDDLEKQYGKINCYVRIRAGNGIVCTTIQEETILSEIQISSEYKTRMLHELDNIGINQASVFPGLEGLGASIKWRNSNYNRNYETFD